MGILGARLPGCVAVKIHAVGSLGHYRDHVEAVWKHLPSDLKGEESWGRGASSPRSADPRDLVMVAGFYDLDRARGHKVIYVEHGAGQSYWAENSKPHEAYHGSEHPDKVVAYISPNQRVADSWGRPAFACGSPVCDPHPLITNNPRPVVAITFHWDCLLFPETRSAIDHYVTSLGPLVRFLRKEGFEVLGHHHPRDRRLPTIWRNLQVPEVDVHEVRDRADVLIADNTSLAFEMLYLNRTVVTLNAPWYRRDVEHGLRFWENTPGWAVDNPEELFDLDWLGLVTDPGLRPQSMAPAVAAYDKALSDGADGTRAAAWSTVFVAGL